MLTRTDMTPQESKLLAGSYQPVDGRPVGEPSAHSAASDGTLQSPPRPSSSSHSSSHADRKDKDKRDRQSTTSTSARLCKHRLHLRRYRSRKWFVPLFILVALLALGAIIGGSFASYMRTSFKFRSRASSTQDRTLTDDYITLNGKVTAVDLPNAKITILWTLFGCGTTLSTSVKDEDCSTPDYPFDVYQNENTTSAAHTRLANNTIQYNTTKRVYGFDPKAQSYYWDADSKGAGPGYYWGYWQTWSQDLQFSISYLTESRRANDLAYPFDKYKVITSLLVVQPDEHKTYPVTPIFSGVISNWAISTNSFSSNSSSAFDWIDPNSQQLTITVERSGAAIAFAMCIFIVNWTITLVVLFQLMLILIWRREFSESLVLFPITALFAMPALRNVAPGNPSFGSFYDVCGFVLQISLVGLTAAIILLMTIIKSEHVFDPNKESRSRLQVAKGMETLLELRKGKSSTLPTKGSSAADLERDATAEEREKN